MKNKFLIFTFCLMTLSACGSSNTATPDKVQKLALMQEKRMGVIQSLGGTFTSSKATDLLKMVDGKTIFLRSSVLDLESEKYQGKEVEVMGEITRTTDGNQTMDVVSIDVVDTEVSTTQDMPVWVDYNSDNLGLSLKYRDDFDFVDSGNAISIKIKPKATPSAITGAAPVAKMAEIKLELLSKDAAYDLAGEMQVASLSNADVLAGGYNRSKITQQGLDAYKQSNDSGRSIVYYLKNATGSYKISFTASDDATEQTADQNVFYDVLASIGFGGTAMANAADKTASGTDIKAPETENVAPVSEAPALKFDSTDSTAGSDVSLSNGTITGFEKFSSDSQKFSIQYPKSYYFGGVETSPDALKSYQFGSKPLETAPGEMMLDLVKSIPDNGTNVEYGGVAMVKTKSESGVSLYLSQNGKVFKLSGPTAKEGMMQQMLSTVGN